ncbi:hypothetical protein PG993_004847 [Apiospora rasikravindrae]|uniref:Uncharacterized protein n=1 Tax=Apiospora rasikravindrae TaxID=990691 RepID=A0ABR1TGP1_9PEZI
MRRLWQARSFGYQENNPCGIRLRSSQWTKLWGSTGGSTVTRPTLRQAVRDIQRSERTISPGEAFAKRSDEKKSNPPKPRTDNASEGRTSSDTGFEGRTSGKKTEYTEKRPSHHSPGISRQRKPASAKIHADEAHARSTLPFQETIVKAAQDVGASEPYIEVLDDDGSSTQSSLFDERAKSSETPPQHLGDIERSGILDRRADLRRDPASLAQSPSSLEGPDKFSNLKFRAGQFVEKRRRMVAKEICETFWLPNSHFEALGQPPRAADILSFKTVEDDEDGSGPPELERLDVLKDFVFNTEPFFCFRQNVRAFVEEPLYLPLHIRIADRARRGFYNMTSSVSEPRSKPGTGEQRVYYTCKCGHKLFDDYIERRTGALEELKQFLSDSGIHVEAANGDFKSNTTPGGPTLPITNPGTLQTNKPTQRQKSRFPFDIRLPRYWQSQDRMELGKCGQQRTTGAVAAPNYHNYLLLCVPFGNLICKLHQPEVCTIDSDQDFFSLLRVLYSKSRTKLFFMSALKRVKSIQFVQFEMYRRDLTDIRSQPALPPETLQTEYIYDPMPAELTPPIGSNLLVHFFEHPTHAGVLPDLYRRVPKRLREKLSPCPQKGSSLGWGIAFVEGVDTFMFFLCGCAGFFVCLMVAVAWTVAQSDVQGGFGIGAFLLAFMIFSGGLIYSSATTKSHL